MTEFKKGMASAWGLVSAFASFVLFGLGFYPTEIMKFMKGGLYTTHHETGWAIFWAALLCCYAVMLLFIFVAAEACLFWRKPEVEFMLSFWMVYSCSMGVIFLLLRLDIPDNELVWVGGFFLLMSGISFATLCFLERKNRKNAMQAP